MKNKKREKIPFVEGNVVKKVCIFCESWESGGIESFVSKLISHMDLTDLEIDLVVARRGESIFTEKLTGAGVKIIELSGSKLRWWSNCRKFRTLLKEKQYDVVHLNAFHGFQMYYLYLARRGGVPLRIAHSHGSDLRKGFGRNLKLVVHRVGRCLFGKEAAIRWACSGKAAEFLFGEKEDFEFIPNGINSETYRYCEDERKRVRAELGVEEKYVIGSVGRLQSGKNQAFLLDVLAEMNAKKPDCVLLLVGEGEEKEALKEKAERMNLSDRVVFYGLSSRVEELFWAMDVFAFPSLSEGLGLVAIEAQATGLAVVCSEHIPREAEITSLFRRISLGMGKEVWAQSLLEAGKENREDFADAVGRAGFEISCVAQKVRNTYLGETPDLGDVIQ